MSTWMVVEDEPDIYDVLLAMFEIWGIEGVAFVDGSEAVSWIEDVDQGRVRGELPELAILDIRLPEVSGPEVGNRLRKSPILGDIAIVLITAYRLSPEEEEEVIKQAQADLLMYKPLPAMAELRSTMDSVITKHKKAKADGPAASATPTPPPQKPASSPAQQQQQQPQKPASSAKPTSSSPTSASDQTKPAQPDSKSRSQNSKSPDN